MKKVFLVIVILLTAGSVCSAAFWRDKIVAPEGSSNSWFGKSVSISGDVCVVGSDWDDITEYFEGSAFFFQFDGSKWGSGKELTSPDRTPYDCFGLSVSVSGQTCVVGAHLDSTEGESSGSAYVFHYNEPNWIQEIKLTASDASSHDYFGTSVFIEGNICVVGSPEAYGNQAVTGAAYIFQFDGSNWIERQKLFAPDSSHGDGFGNSVSLSDDVCIVGAPEDDDIIGGAGSAYVFRFEDPNWIQETKITASDAAEYDHFGSSVSISGDVCVVGAPRHDQNGESSGSAYIFRFNDPNWVQEVKLTPSDGAAWDRFGETVSIEGNVCIVGARNDDDSGEDSGSAYIFRFDGLGWIQGDKLAAFDAAAGDWFGRSVALDSGNIVVGADGKDGETGAVYTFRPCPQADLTGDCFVGTEDILIFAQQWLTGQHLP